jgi:hypothetical protein
MINSELRDFIDRVVENRRISDGDVIILQRDVLPDGLNSREDAEALLALDRVVDAAENWGEVLCALMVDFVVWGSRPTGYVTGTDALWLAAVLDVGLPTERALHIAYAIVEEAQQVDEALLGFILRGRQRVPRGLAA